MILHRKYLEAIKLVADYDRQMQNAVYKAKELKNNQSIQWLNQTFYVSEVDGDDVLVRSTESETDENYNDYWVKYIHII